MKEPFLRELYTRTVQRYNRQPNEAEFGGWMDVLKEFDYSDVDAALRRWQNDVMIEEFTHRPIGARMPTPPEVKMSIQVFEAKNALSFTPCRTELCNDGWNYFYKGQFIKRGEIIPLLASAKRCKCHREWIEREKMGEKAS